jgi:GGDEF domain-containing protein
MARYSGFDQLTGLPNLRQFLQEVQRELARVRRNGGSMVVMVIEPGVETELSLISGRLRELVREEDVVARLGEVMLGVLLVSTSPDAGRLVASRLQSALKPVVPVAVGIRFVEPEPGKRFKSSELIREAAAALAQARRNGGELMAAWNDLALNH